MLLICLVYNFKGQELVRRICMEDSITAFSHGKTNDKVFDLITQHNLNKMQIIDVGAGEGYFSQMMGEFIRKEYSVSPENILKACDLFPEQFKYSGITCDKANINQNLPYEGNTFDIACSIEVMEHIENQFDYVRELYRILKSNGRAIITTPNILNANSRLKFLHSGFWLLFDPLPLKSGDPVHLSGHINPVSFYFMAAMLYKAGFKEVNLHFDRIKTSGLIYASLLYPIIKLLHSIYERRLKKKSPDIYIENARILDKINQIQMLCARTIVIEAIK